MKRRTFLKLVGAGAAASAIASPAIVSAQDAITQSAGLLDAIYAKRLPVPGLDPAARDGYGGVQFTPSSVYSVGGRPKRFNLRNSGF